MHRPNGCPTRCAYRPLSRAPTYTLNCLDSDLVIDRLAAVEDVRSLVQAVAWKPSEHAAGTNSNGRFEPLFIWSGALPRAARAGGFDDLARKPGALAVGNRTGRRIFVIHLDQLDDHAQQISERRSA